MGNPALRVVSPCALLRHGINLYKVDGNRDSAVASLALARCCCRPRWSPCAPAGRRAAEARPPPDVRGLRAGAGVGSPNAIRYGSLDQMDLISSEKCTASLHFLETSSYVNRRHISHAELPKRGCKRRLLCGRGRPRTYRRRNRGRRQISRSSKSRFSDESIQMRLPHSVFVVSS